MLYRVQCSISRLLEFTTPRSGHVSDLYVHVNGSLVDGNNSSS